MNKKLYNTLSWSWGLPMTFIGKLAEITLVTLGYEPKKYGYATYFEVGEGWGGMTLGKVFIVSKDCGEYTKIHEYGHTLQNCIYGFFMLFLICIPSVVRYWYREIKYNRKGSVSPKDYDSVWFEGQATKWGMVFLTKRGMKNEQ